MTSYRKLALLAKCLIYDTKGSYSSASKRFKKEDLDVDVTGQVFLITGANSGIGFATATEIARRGGEVHMVCRSPEKGEQARNSIEAETGNNNIYLHILDMSNPQDVAKFARTFVKEHEQLDVLVNNAGEMVNEMRQTEQEGLDVNFVTNSLGPYLLTQGLLPLIKASKKHPRVVTVTSAGMLLERLSSKYFDNLKAEGYDGIAAYGQCKRQVTVLTEHWSSLYPEIHFSCNHPGWVDTPAAKRGLGEFYDRMKPKFRTPQQGADTVIWLCLSNAALKAKSGEFFQDRQVFSKHLPLALTRESQEERRAFLQLMESHEKKQQG